MAVRAWASSSGIRFFFKPSHLQSRWVLNTVPVSKKIRNSG